MFFKSPNTSPPMSFLSSTMTLLTMMTFYLWLSCQLTSHPSLAYNLYPLPVNWDPLVELNSTTNNIASLLTSDSLTPAAAECVSHLNTRLNASLVCKEQLYDWFKIEGWKRSMLIRKYIQFTLTCYFRLACVNCPAEQVTAFGKVIPDYFYMCNDAVPMCFETGWTQPALTQCFDPPMTELAQCDAALEQANSTDKCATQVQLKLDQTKEVHPRLVKCTAEYEDRVCMVAQVCQHCQPKHVLKYFEYWDKMLDPAVVECWSNEYAYKRPIRACPQDYTLVMIIIGVVVALLLIVIFYRNRNVFSVKRNRKYGSTVGGGPSSNKNHSTSRSSTASSPFKPK